MKTSLVIDDRIFQAAKREAQRSGRTVSELICEWARVGLQTVKTAVHRRRRTLKTADLGGPARVDLSNRRDWMDTLDT